MTQKSTAPFLFALSALLAGSITLNVMQANATKDPNLQRAKANVVGVIKDTRRSATLLQNNTDAGWMIISYDAGMGRTATAKIWLAPNATMSRIHGTPGADGVIANVSVEPLEQTGFQIGEQIYIQFTNSLERSRLEANTVVAGDLLPLTN